MSVKQMPRAGAELIAIGNAHGAPSGVWPLGTCLLLGINGFAKRFYTIGALKTQTVFYGFSSIPPPVSLTSNIYIEISDFMKEI